MDAEKDVEIIAKDTVFKGYFQIDRYKVRHRTFAGGWTHEITREVFERGHAVGVLLYDPVRDQVALIEQFRIGALAAGWHPWLIECVAGIIDEGETPEQVAAREVTEEAGCVAGELLHIGDYLMTAGGSSETVRFFCTPVDCSKIAGIHGLEHEGEDIRVMVVDTDEAYSWVKQGKVTNAMAVVALQWLVLERDNLRKRWG